MIGAKNTCDGGSPQVFDPDGGGAGEFSVSATVAKAGGPV